MKVRLICLLLFFTCNSLLAQENKNILTSTVRYHYGVVMPHHKSISYIINDKITAIELNLGFIPSADKNWAKLYKQPEVGLGIYHGSLGNKEVLGNVTALFPYLNFPISSGEKWELNTQFGIGIGFTKKHFDAVNNYRNIAIGTKFNAFFKLMVNGTYHLNSKWNINAGLGFNHMSNGSISAPNKGLNLLTASIGTQYYWNDKKINRANYKPLKGKLANQFTIIWGHGIKQTAAKDHHKYYASSLSSGYSIGINAKQQIGFGIDLFYDTAANRGKWDFEPEIGFKNRFSQAIFISHHIVIQSFTIVANIGVYTYFNTSPEKPLYTRLGVRYQLNKHFMTSLSLKAHMGKADFIEWGIGYRIKRKKNEK